VDVKDYIPILKVQHVKLLEFGNRIGYLVELVIVILMIVVEMFLYM
jgi:hypothetical protein